MLTTEAEEEYKSIRGHDGEMGLRNSYNFSNGAGKISAIDFHVDAKKDSASDISFDRFEIDNRGG